MKRSMLIWGVVFLLVVGNTAIAAESPYSAGSVTMAGGGTFMVLSSDDFAKDATVILIYPAFGYFFTDRICLNAQLLLAGVSQGDDDLSVMAIGPQLIYYFGNPSSSSGNSGRAVPYVTASVLFGQISSGSNETDARAITFGGGVNAMMAQNIGGYFEVDYSFDKLENDEGFLNYEGNRLMLQAGLRLFLW